jgi:hypothetical protein
MYETTLTGRLPGLDIEVSRRQSPDGSAEIVAISLRAVPDLATAVERLAPAALLMGPFAPGNRSALPAFMPFAAWMPWLQAAAQASPWAPWLAFNPWLAAWIPELQPVDEGTRASPP